MTAPTTTESEVPESVPLPQARMEALCDPGTFKAIRTLVESPRMGAKMRPGDGVLAGSGRVDGRPVFCYAQDAAYLGGSLGEAHADTICRALEMAGRARAPVVGFVSSGGARMQEGMHALGGYASIFRATVALTGLVPQISVICSLSAGGGSYSPALTDFTLMLEGSAMFLTGPGVVREVMGEDVTAEALGGTGVHSRNGVCDLVAADDDEAVGMVQKLLSFLPSRGAAPLWATPRPASLSDPGSVVPAEPRKVYDVRRAMDGIVDEDSFLEISPRWGPNMVVGFARIEGRAVGIVANQPHYLGGVIDATASEKATRFINACAGFGVPLVVLADTPGFMPGTKQEQAGVIRHGAGLLRAFAAAKVPKITVVLRKAYGGAYITMNSRYLGADLVLSWPDAEIGIMGAQQAVNVIHRRESPEERKRLAGVYAAEHLTAQKVAAIGYVDEIIAPVDTRARLAWALDALSGPPPGGVPAIDVPQ